MQSAAVQETYFVANTVLYYIILSKAHNECQMV